MVKVLLATSWDTPHHCGIEDHSRMLIDAVATADPTITITPSADALNPWQAPVADYDVLHLNYHAALHSQWTPERIRFAQIPTVVTYHDTGVPNSDQCKAVVDAASAAVVHEPFDDLPSAKTHYWRMGVPELDGRLGARTTFHHRRPILGTVGHPFPWKNLDRLCETARQAGWGVLIYCPSMGPTEQARLHALNPWLTIREGHGTQDVLAGLRDACDATAFLFTCANTGQSASTLQGIAARKPVIAFHTCRQMRGLYDDPLGSVAIYWCEAFEEVQQQLAMLPLGRFDSHTVALAEQDSWRHLGPKYAALYRSLAR